MNNHDCEIVDSWANGTAFQYCRTHKKEPQDCPGSKQEVVIQTPWTNLEPRKGYTKIGVDLAASPIRPVFKVGDKVKVKSGNSYSSQRLNGQICTVSGVMSDVVVTLQEEGDYVTGVWTDELELV